MRLWHKDLIDILPRPQLLAQWRECCAIAKEITVNGSPNHILVNKIMNYPLSHFQTYAMMILNEMAKRGYSCQASRFLQWWPNNYGEVAFDDLFSSWMNGRYFWQCYSNLEEKYDCGGISDDDWIKIEGRMRKRLLI